MNGSTEVARRPGAAPAQAVPAAALTLRSGQTRFDDQQRSALATLGIKTDAPQADLDVFLHVSQRMGLDPFAKQIHLIYYRVNEPAYNPRTRQMEDNWVDKPSIQTGIAGFRVQRDRVATRLGVLIDYEDTLWFDENGKPTDVWLSNDHPTACRVVTKISDGRRFGATIRFNEFAKRSKTGQLTGRWRDGHSYQIEKCAEAASLRKAFPQDFAGLDLDAEIETDPDAPASAAVQPERPRVTAADARARAPQRAAAEVIRTDPSPAAAEPPAATPQPPAEAAGEVPASREQLEAIVGHLDRLGVEPDGRLRVVSLVAGRALKSSANLTAAEALKVDNTLEGLADGAALDGLRAEQAMADDPRGEDGEPGAE
jgi:phage recombination protein Bet